jgi:PBP1b-binding outer membrane lipoprotein LpoB
MKTHVAIILAAVVVAGCSNKPASTDIQPTAGGQSTPSKAERSQSAGSQTTAGAPVEFTYGGITSDKTNISYRIKVNTDKPISQVDLAVEEMDDSGKVLMDTTMLWQNIVKSVRLPIEKGKTYDVQDYLYPGATKAECKLKRVVFQDGTTWGPK